MPSRYRFVGQNVQDVGGYDKVTGRATYCNDVRLPGMLHSKVLRSPHARAKILSFDLSQAAAAPGVKLVMTKDNFPQVLFEYIQYVGQDVAVVIAETEEQALKACRLIKVEYEVLDPVITPERAMEADAPQALASLPNVYPQLDSAYFMDKNEQGLYTKRLLRKEYVEAGLGQAEDVPFDGFGDVEQGFAASDYIVEQDGFRYAKAHGPLIACSGCVASFSGGNLDIYLTTQIPHSNRLILSGILKLPQSRINLHSRYNSSAFGAMLNSGILDTCLSGPSYTLLSSVATMTLSKPVRLFYTQEEMFIYYWGRGSLKSKVKLGFKKDGALTTMDTEICRNTSTAGSIGLATLLYDATCTGNMLYAHNVRHNRLRKSCVSTNSPAFTGWQGFGNPEVFLAVESTMDMAAEKLGIDPVELRLKNHMRQGDNFLSLAYAFSEQGSYLAVTAIDKCLKIGAEKVDWGNRKPHTEKSGRIRHGKGMSIVCQQNGGQLFESNAIVDVLIDGTAILTCNYQDMGQGSHTTQQQMVAEILNIGMDKVNLEAGHTKSSPCIAAQSCSSGSLAQGFATYNAAMAAKNQLLNFASQALQLPADQLDTKDGMIFPKGAPEKVVPWAAAFKVKNPDYSHVSIVGVGQNLVEPGPTPSEQGATFVDLDVDTETGQLLNVKVTQVQDCGTALNPRVVEGHYLGIHHGLEALAGGAEMVLDKKTGKVLNNSWVDYSVASMLDFHVVPVISETPSPTHPFGAVGIGQAFQNGLAAAVANAIYNAIGVRLKETPFTPAKILAALGKI